MQDAFGYVIFGVAIVGVLLGVGAVLFGGDLHAHIGRGGLSLNEDGPPKPQPGGAVYDAERDAEIRQMLVAKNARRAARGEDERDVDEEMAELNRPVIDPALRAEIRELVVARNNRRMARGREPLDVDAEVERQISQLSG